MYRLLLGLLSISCWALVPSAVPADGPPGYIAEKKPAETEYEQAAHDAYGMGYAFIERATRFDHDAAAATHESARSEAVRGAREAYEDALRAFEDAVRSDDRMYEAHTYIGYANRKLGRYDLALAAYEQALQLKPDYARAIEYQGEAFLGIDRFDRAKLNYLRLYALDAEQAEKLLVAMRRWLTARMQSPGAAPEHALNDASRWLADRPASGPPTRLGEAAPW